MRPKRVPEPYLKAVGLVTGNGQSKSPVLEDQNGAFGEGTYIPSPSQSPWLLERTGSEEMIGSGASG